MGTQRERYEAFFRRRRGAREPDNEAALLRAADALDEATASGVLTTEQLQRIVDAAGSRMTLQSSNACELLGAAAGRWPEAADAVEALSRSRLAHARFSAMCSLLSGMPLDRVDQVIRRGCADAAANVRWKAAEVARRMGREAVVPEIAAALAKESNDRARASIELDLHLLRDGYMVEQRGDATITVTVPFVDGVIEGITSEDFSEEEIRSKGIESIVAEMQRSRRR